MSQLAENLSYWWKAIALVDVETCDFGVLSDCLKCLGIHDYVGRPFVDAVN